MKCYYYYRQVRFFFCFCFFVFRLFVYYVGTYKIIKRNYIRRTVNTRIGGTDIIVYVRKTEGFPAFTPLRIRVSCIAGPCLLGTL